MRWPDYKYIFIFLTIAATIPIWLIPIAPLSDWPAHLAISKEIFLLATHQVNNPYYYLQTSFLGYSLMYGLLAGLQALMPLEWAGKLVLALAVALVPVSWWLFFDILAPKKRQWFVWGMLITLFTMYFYAGLVATLFAWDFGLVFLAVGIDALRNGRSRVPFLLLLGVLTYLSQAYIFFLAGGALLLAYIWEVFWHKKPAPWPSMAALIILFAAALASLAFNPSSSGDMNYYNSISNCVTIVFEKATFSVNQNTLNFALGGIMDGLNRLLALDFFRTIFPLGTFWVLIPILVIVLLVNLIQDSHSSGRAPSQLIRWPSWGKISVDHFYLGLAALFYLHQVLMPTYIVNVSVFASRSLPFALAFLLLSLNFSKGLPKALFYIPLLLVLANIAYQSVMFYQHIPVQQQIAAQAASIAAALPANSTLMVIPAYQTSDYNLSTIPFANPDYQGLVLIDNPKVYIAGLWSHLDAYPLRSTFPLFDDMNSYGPIPAGSAKNISGCFYPVPKEFGYYTDENFQLHKN